MNTTIKTGLAAMLLLAIACKKENNTIQTSRGAGNTSTQNSMDDPGVQAQIKIGTQIWMTTSFRIAAECFKYSTAL